MSIELGADYLETLAYLQALPHTTPAEYVQAFGAPECARRHREQCERNARWYVHEYPQLKAQGYRHGRGHEPGAHVAWVTIDGRETDLWVVKLPEAEKKFDNG